MSGITKMPLVVTSVTVPHIVFSHILLCPTAFTKATIARCVGTQIFP